MLKFRHIFFDKVVISDVVAAKQTKKKHISILLPSLPSLYATVFFVTKFYAQYNFKPIFHFYLNIRDDIEFLNIV